jgi:hypothetical protein
MVLGGSGERSLLCNDIVSCRGCVRCGVCGLIGCIILLLHI